MESTKRDRRSGHPDVYDMSQIPYRKSPQVGVVPAECLQAAACAGQQYCYRRIQSTSESFRGYDAWTEGVVGIVVLPHAETLPKGTAAL